MNDRQFRTASMGGFVKKDVLDYLDNLENEFHAKLSALEKVVAATQAYRNEAEQRLAAYEQSRGQNVETTQQLNVQLQQTRQELAGIREQLQVKEAELQAARGDLEHLHSSADELVATKRQVEQLRAQFSQQENQYKSELAQARGEIEQLHSSLAQAPEDIRPELEAAQREISELRQQMEEKTSALMDLQDENRSLRDKLSAAGENRGSGSVSAQLLLELQAQLEQRNRQVIEINAELEELRERTKDYDLSIKGLEAIQARTSQIELVARERAEQIVAAAAQESMKFKEELEAWFADMEKGYQALKKDTEVGISQATEEAMRTQAAIRRIAAVEEDRPVTRSSSTKQFPFEVMTTDLGEVRNA